MSLPSTADPITPPAEDPAAAAPDSGTPPAAEPSTLDQILASVPENVRDSVRKAVESGTEATRKSLLGDYTRKAQAVAEERRRIEQAREELERIANDPDVLEARARRARGPAPVTVDWANTPLEQAVPQYVQQIEHRLRSEMKAEREAAARELRRLQSDAEIERAYRTYGQDFLDQADEMDRMFAAHPEVPAELQYLAAKGKITIASAQAESQRREQERLAKTRTNKSIPPPASGQPVGKPSGPITGWAAAISAARADREAART